MIVSDASPLIAFARIQQLHILTETLGELIIPQVVFEECCRHIEKPGAREIEKSVKNKSISVNNNQLTETVKDFQYILDTGELHAISLAIELGSGLLIDEKLGRSIAQNLHLKIIGTAGVLLLAYRKNIITSIPEAIESLQQAGYYLSNKLVSELLAKV